MSNHEDALYRALNVLVKDPAIRGHIDTKALVQAEKAIEIADKAFDDATFVVVWNDGVANEWVEVVHGPLEASEAALDAHVERGEDEGSFLMKYLRVSHNIGSEDINIVATRTVDDFINNPACPWFDDEEAAS